MKTLTTILKKLLSAYYFLVSPWLGNRCRFVPSCSEYALQALDLHGPFIGSWMALKRIFRCNPWGKSGYDPVPGADLRPGSEKSRDKE